MLDRLGQRSYLNESYSTVSSTSEQRMSGMLALLVTIFVASTLFVNGENFTIGYLSTFDHIEHMQGSAISIAIEDFKAKGWLKEHDFR